MKKFQKEQLLEAVQSIEQLHKEIKREFKLNSIEKVKSLLILCQETAINMGMFIEGIEGEGTKAVGLLEEYCELLYQCHNQAEDQENLFSFFETLENQLVQIIDNICSEFQTKKEIVFLPYKASMWDSMESIWFAAKDDSKCDCYVIPIPYYDRAKDRTFSEEHYEAKLFPEYVLITSYEEYDLKVRKPDVIYFHNPYDQFNFATSVHPAFYSKELKQCTEMLVYVPYYATGGTLSDAFYQLPAYYYADKIVIQSEVIQNYYVKDVWNKLLPFGSPKYDKIVNNRKEEILNPYAEITDGKKVVMLNTSISGVLQNSERAIAKIRYIFECFKKRNDVVLLWRPHPLLKATLKSMRPELWTSYCKLEEDFLAEKIGVFDTISDITNSITLCDAYIGEESSSVVHLFGVSGKPIFILDTNLTNNSDLEDTNAISFMDCFIEENEIWFVAQGHNLLCRMDRNSGEITEVIKLASVNNDNTYAFCDLIKINNKIIIQPHTAAHICIYDIDKNELKKIKLEKPVSSNFCRMIRYKNDIFMMPKSHSAILKLSITDERPVYYWDCLKEFIVNSNEYMFMEAFIARGNRLIMASAQTNKVLDFDMETGEYQIHTVGSQGNNYFAITYDGEDYWLLPNEGKNIVRWNYESGEFCEYNNYPKGYIGDTRGLKSMICCGDYLLAFPREGNMIIQIDKRTGAMSEYKLNLPYKEGQRKSGRYTFVTNYHFAKKLHDNLIVAFSNFDSRLLFLNPHTKELQFYECRLNEEACQPYKEYAKDFYRQGQGLPYACRESVFYPLGEFLDDFIDSIDFKWNVNEQYKAYLKIAANLDGTCGEKIHSYMMKHV